MKNKEVKQSPSLELIKTQIKDFLKVTKPTVTSTNYMLDMLETRNKKLVSS